MSVVDEEQPKLNPRDQLVKEKSLTMEYFLESRNLDKVTEQMLLKYDRDGDGAFSKDEVVSIIIDLRQEHVDNDKLSATNKLYKRLLCTAIVLCFLLLAGMFALSYAVAALTAKTDVRSDGTMVAIGTDIPVATDSRAEIHILPRTEDGLFCITSDEIELMHFEILNGRDVVLDQEDSSAGTGMVTKLSGGSVSVNGEETCFTTAAGETKCASPHPACQGRSVGRRLSSEDRRRLGMPERRRLQNPDSCYGCIVGGSSVITACLSIADNSTLVAGGPGDGPPAYSTYMGCYCTMTSDCAAGSWCMAAPSGVCYAP